MGRKLVELTPQYIKEHRSRAERKFGMLYKPLKYFQGLYQRFTGNFAYEDGLRVSCYCEPPMYFLRRGCMIPHPFGITLSADDIGADCQIGPNVTIGTDGRNIRLGGPISPISGKPTIGNLVRIYAGAVVSGNIRIGNCVIVGANSFVNKDVPDNSFVIGHNVIRPLQAKHRHYLATQLWFCTNVYQLVPGLVYSSRRLLVDLDYAQGRVALLGSLMSDDQSNGSEPCT